MKALFNGKEIDIELSKKAKKELDDLRKEIDPEGILEGVRCVEPKWSYLLYCIEGYIDEPIAKGFCKELRKEVNKIVTKNEDLVIEKIEKEKKDEVV